MVEHTFLLEDISPLELYGVNNLRLHQIEEGFPEVRFVARGDELKIKGEEERITLLKGLLAALVEEIRRKGRLSEARFRELMAPQAPAHSEAGVPDAPPPGDEDEVLVHGASGLMIRAKNRGQRQIVASARENDVVFAVGPAGTGKTYIAVALAVKALKEKQVRKIILCRPAVDAGESLGFLPGDLREKIDPYLRPLYDALGDMVHSEKLKFYLDNGVIEIAPLAYMRGRTLNHAFVIMDEAQNATEMQMKMFLTRLGERSRMIITGDDSQIDLPPKQRSGLLQALRLLQGIRGIGVVRLQNSDVVRHRLVREILGAYEKADKAVK